MQRIYHICEKSRIKVNDVGSKEGKMALATIMNI